VSVLFWTCSVYLESRLFWTCHLSLIVSFGLKRVLLHFFESVASFFESAVVYSGTCSFLSFWERASSLWRCFNLFWELLHSFKRALVYSWERCFIFESVAYSEHVCFIFESAGLFYVRLWEVGLSLNAFCLFWECCLIELLFIFGTYSVYSFGECCRRTYGLFLNVFYYLELLYFERLVCLESVALFERWLILELPVLSWECCLSLIAYLWKVCFIFMRLHFDECCFILNAFGLFRDWVYSLR
jgi:hypothetical protein